MSSSFVIPLSALFTSKGECVVGWKTETVFCPDYGYDGLDNPIISRMNVVLVHTITINGINSFEVHPEFHTEANGSTSIRSVSFTGFKHTCKQLQDDLGITVDIE